MRITFLLRFILVFWIFLLVFSKSNAQPCGWIEKVEQLCLPGTNKARFKVFWNPPQPGYNGGFTVKNPETGETITPTSPGIYDVNITHNTVFEIQTVGPVATCGPPQIVHKEIIVPTAPDKVLCKSTSYPNLNSFNPTPFGGTWSGSYVSADGTISPGIPLGTYSFLYTYTSPALNCTNSDIVSITITYNPPPSPSVDQSTIYTCADKDFTATAIKSDPSYTIRWYRQQTGGTPISSEETVHYSSPNPTLETFWACAVNANGCESTSRTQVVFTPYTGDPVSGGTASCAPATGTVVVSTTNSIRAWQKSYNGGSSWITLDNAPKTTSYTYSETESVLIRAIVLRGRCLVNSQAATITVNKSVGGTPVASYTVNSCRNIQGTISLGNSKIGDIQAWYVSKDKFNWKIITGINLNSPVPFQVTDTTKYYFATVRFGTCTVDSSDIIAIHSRAYAGNVKVLSQVNCHTATGTLELMDKYGEVNRWEYSENPDDSESWIKIANSNNVIYGFNNVTKNTWFRAVVKLVTCLDSAYSPVASIQVSNPPVGMLARSEASETCDSIASPITFKGQFKLIEYSGQIVRWEKYDVSGKWDIIPNSANKESYDYQVNKTTRFRVRLAMNGCDDIYSGEATFYVNPAYVGKERKASATIQKYDGHSYISNGSIILSKGFKFYANSCQDFSITVDENYTLAHSNENFVLVETIQKEGIKDIEEINWLGATDKVSEYNYFDGLGRYIQTVIRKASPNQYDMIHPVKYDNLGRIDFEYLPYVATTKDGTFQEDFEIKQREFYVKNNDAIPNTIHPFSRKIFDESPLNRIMEQGASGTTWQPLSLEGGGKTAKICYSTNSEMDIKLWKVKDSLPVFSGYYALNELTVTISINERGFQFKEYTNKLGQLILRKTESKNKTGATVWLQTYYIYNSYGKECFVLPPEAVSRLEGSPSDDFLKLWAYCYQYDAKQRVVKKRIPGTAWAYFFYDDASRLRITQDGLQRKKKEYIVIKYDDLGRAIMTVLWKDSLNLNRNQIQKLLNEQAQWYEEKASINHGYTLNRSFPINALYINVINVTYYDDYRFLKKGWYSSTGYDYTSELGNPVSHNIDVRGLISGKKIKILKSGIPKWLKVVSYYDQKYRPIQAIKENHIGGNDRISTLFDFSGKALRTINTHLGYGNTPIRINDTYSYDHAGRLLTRQHSINNKSAVNMAQNSYNELGALIEKNLHGTSTGFLQSIDYRYHIRGWIASINNFGLITDGGITNNDITDVFGMELKYDSDLIIDPLSPQYNGNVAEILWRNLSDDKPKGYSFTYDPLNRLKEARYKSFVNNSWNNVEQGRFNEGISEYDLNGNIVTLTRNGVVGYNSNSASFNYGKMDSLSYEYIGNHLMGVKDVISDIIMTNGFNSQDFSDGITDNFVYDKNNPDTHDYAYDDNGNMWKDKNKGIESISYNLLNLIEKVILKDGKYIIYEYDGTGAKISRKVYSSLGIGIDSTKYVGSIEYKGDSISQIMTGEGRILKNGNNFQYQYFLTDHLGNVRVVVESGTNGNARIVQTNDYYPFGMEHGGQSFVSGTENLYKYAGKEEQKEMALIDFGARMYSPVIGRWFAIDPKAEQTITISPFNYCANNPLIFIDPNGMEIIFGGGKHGGDLITGEDAVRFGTILQNNGRTNIFIGNECQVEEINSDSNNKNWLAFQAKDLIQVRELLKTLNFTVTNVFIVNHGSGQSICVLPALGKEDMTVDDWHNAPNCLDQIDLDRYSKVQNKTKEEIEMDGYETWYTKDYPHVEALIEIINMVEDNGSFVMGACMTTYEGSEFIERLYSLTDGNVNIYGNNDLNNLHPNVILNKPITSDKFCSYGWGIIGPMTDGKFKRLTELSPNNTGRIILRKSGRAVDFERERNK